jgi:hypothetical protein
MTLWNFKTTESSPQFHIILFYINLNIIPLFSFTRPFPASIGATLFIQGCRKKSVSDLPHVRLNVLLYICVRSYQTPYHTAHKEPVPIFNKICGNEKCMNMQQARYMASNISGVERTLIWFFSFIAVFSTAFATGYPQGCRVFMW